MAIHFHSIPKLAFWCPADGNETSAAYLVALQSPETPSILSLSRQNLPNLENSEVSIALEAASKLRVQGIGRYALPGARGHH
jgi:transketolase